MSRSFDWCVKRASDPANSSFSDRDWSSAVEIPSESFYNKMMNERYNYTITGHNDIGKEVIYKINVELNPETEFDYFTYEACLHDGTLLFIGELLEKCLKKVIFLNTYNKKYGPPPNGCQVNIKIGNFIALSEYNKEFAPDEKPWLVERTTVLLPLSIRYE